MFILYMFWRSLDNLVYSIFQNSVVWSWYCTRYCNAPVNWNPHPPTPGKYGALALEYKKNVIMPHIHGPCFLSKPQVKWKNSPTPGGNHHLHKNCDLCFTEWDKKYCSGKPMGPDGTGFFSQFTICLSSLRVDWESAIRTERKFKRAFHIKQRN